MTRVVSHNQSSFISERSTNDNILVLQQTIHALTHLHGNKGFTILKHDLEKSMIGLNGNLSLNPLTCLAYLYCSRTLCTSRASYLLLSLCVGS